MEDISAKNRKINFCPNCKISIERSITQINENNQCIIFCPYCGIEIPIAHSDINDDLESRTENERFIESSDPKELLFIQIHVTKIIYNLIKQKKSIMKKLIKQKDILSSQISNISRKARKKLLKPLDKNYEKSDKEINNKISKVYNKFIHALKGQKNNYLTFNLKATILLCQISFAGLD